MLRIVAGAVPAVELADRPHGSARGAQTVNAVPRTAPVAPVLAVVRAEHMPELFVASADEVQVELPIVGANRYGSSLVHSSSP